MLRSLPGTDRRSALPRQQSQVLEENRTRQSGTWEVAATAGSDLQKKGDEQLAEGNIAAARLFYERAANIGLVQGAMALAGTFDAQELVHIPEYAEIALLERALGLYRLKNLPKLCCYTCYWPRGDLECKGLAGQPYSIVNRENDNGQLAERTRTASGYWC